jgi:uncharacterized protein
MKRHDDNPHLSMSKHATPIDPRATWEHLAALPPSEQAMLRTIVTHMRQAMHAQETGAPKRHKAGVSVLFAGPASVKTMAAEVLARDLELPLDRVDLSSVISKYIGETEKNLDRIFEAAAKGGWILFFDEADALFGGRTEVRDGHDRCENIDTSYLLQRMEDYEGVSILASNFRDQIDGAFIRRLSFVVHFPTPGPSYLMPGVYVEEQSAGVHGIDGIETGTAAFLGQALQGPVGIAQLVTSWAEFQQIYGSGSAAASHLAASVRGFFENGGTKCFVLRVDDKGADDDYIAGLNALKEAEVNILCAPGIWSLRVQRAMLDHCAEMRDRMCILDPPKGATVPEVVAMRKQLASHGYGALYYPWIRVKRTMAAVPPSGHVAGMYARIDAGRGVWKAPAGVEAALSGATGLERRINKADEEKLSSRGINCIRAIPGRGILVWGNRTLADDPELQYVHIRRTLLYIEGSIRRGTLWAVFEPVNEQLFMTIRRSIEAFLLGLWRSGALIGARPEEAFFVKCDDTTTTQTDITEGRLIFLTGIALLKPAEFVVLHFQQGIATS